MKQTGLPCSHSRQRRTWGWTMQHMTSGMVKSVDLPQQQTVLIMENQPRRDYEGRGLHRLTDPPFLHATHHYHLSAFTYTIFPEHFQSGWNNWSTVCVLVCIAIFSTTWPMADTGFEDTYVPAKQLWQKLNVQATTDIDTLRGKGPRTVPQKL